MTPELFDPEDSIQHLKNNSRLNAAMTLNPDNLLH